MILTTTWEIAGGVAIWVALAVVILGSIKADAERHNNDNNNGCGA